MRGNNKIIEQKEKVLASRTSVTMTTEERVSGRGDRCADTQKDLQRLKIISSARAALPRQQGGGRRETLEKEAVWTKVSTKGLNHREIKTWKQPQQIIC